MLEEQDRVVAADRGAQQAGGVLRVRRKHDAQPGDVREDALAALRVIDGAAGEVSADGDANHDGAGESVVRAPADHAEFVANLHHRRPDVVEELNLDDRLQAARGHARGAAYDGGLGQRRVEDAVAAEFVLQAEGEFEDSAFAFDQLALQIFFAAAVADVFAENHDALVALHFIAQRRGDQVGHGLGGNLFAVGRDFGHDRLRVERRRRRDRCPASRHTS